MKKTLFLAALLATIIPTNAATYTNLTSAWCDADNNVIYDGQGYFAVESGSTTSVDLTIDLDALVSYVNSNDYKTGGYMLLWDMEYDYGLADNADMSLGTGARTPYISGYWNGGAWNTGTNNISYNTLSQYANNGSLTLTITSNSSDGVTVSARNNTTNTSDNLYSADSLRTDSNKNTSGYYINLNYVTAVTLNTASTLDTDSYIPPQDYTKPFVSNRTDDTTIGRVTFLGDSITHGVNDQSYRWQLFKTLVDNGIENQIAGPRAGYYSSPGHTEDAGSRYGGTTFANVHLAQASGRTHNIISGKVMKEYTCPETNITYKSVSSGGVNYGGHSTASTAASYDSNTWFCLMGTNDLLSDTTGNDSAEYVAQTQKMLGGTVSYNAESDTYQWTAGDSWGTMGIIVNDVYSQGDTFYMLSITPWGNHSNHEEDLDHYAAQEFNRNLEAWTKAYSESTGKNVVYIDITRGMVDLTDDKRFMGHDNFFNNSSDRLHPNDQGSIIMAGNLARNLGIGGRTAGLTRADKNTADTTWHTATPGTDGKLSQNSNYVLAENAFTQDGGYTVDFRAVFGNGSTDGWLGSDNTLSISIGDGINSGTLNLSEGYIMWGTDVLFCADTSALDENLRIAWHNGNSADNVLNGYYVWLGDMLIGQGLDATTGTGLNGIAITTGETTGSITDLSWANTAYAPTTTGSQSTEYSYITQQDAGNSSLVSNTYIPMPNFERQSAAHTLNSNLFTPEQSQNIVATNTGTLVTTATEDTSSISNFVVTTTSSLANYYNITNQSHKGTINVQFNGDVTGAIIGVNGNKTAGHIHLQLTSDSSIEGEGNYGGVVASIAGSFAGGKAASFNVYVDGANIGNDIVGGSINGTGSIDAVTLTINSGVVDASIYGGSKVANATVGKSTIEVNGGTITGGIVAGGSKGTIGDVDVIINGGIIRGSISKGEAARKEGASTRVTVVGNKALIGGNIEADTVTLKDVSATAYSDSFDKYANTITANKLVINNVQTDLAAQVEVSQIELTNAATTSLVMGDAASLETLVLDDNTTFGAFKSGTDRSVSTAGETTLTLRALTAGKGATLNANIVLGADSTLSLEGALTMGSSVELSRGMVIDLSADLLTQFNNGATIAIFESVDSLTLDGIGITADTFTETQFNIAEQLQSVSLGYSSSGTVSIKLIPEPTTATLSLLALAALAARRRRR